MNSFLAEPPYRGGQFSWPALWPGIVAVFMALLALPWANQTYVPIYHFFRHLPLGFLYSVATRIPCIPVIAFIIAAIFKLHPRRRATIPYFVVSLLLTVGVNESIKHLASRARPASSIRMSEKFKTSLIDYNRTHADSGVKPLRQDQWLGPEGQHPSQVGEYASFPSGDANAAFSMATYLSAVYPAASAVWYAGATSTAIARVARGRHWPEDVLFGAALGWLLSKIVLSWIWPGRLGLWLFGSDKQRPGWCAREYGA